MVQNIGREVGQTLRETRIRNDSDDTLSNVLPPSNLVDFQKFPTFRVGYEKLQIISTP